MLIVFFLCAIFVPGVMMLGGWSVGPAQAEKRSLAPLPACTPESCYTSAYRRAFESYVNDHFGFRPALVQWNLYLYVQWFHTVPVRGVALHRGEVVTVPIPTDDAPGVLPDVEDRALAADQEGTITPSPALPEPESQPREHVVIETDAIVGTDGWYFLAKDNAIDDFRATQPLSQAELRVIADNLTRQRDALRAQSIDFVVMVAPNKHSIYGEYMPSVYNRVGSQTRLEQVIQYVAAYTDMTIVDPRGDLLAGKRTLRAYEKTGTHWNEYGALIAYQALLRQVRQFIPSLAIPTLDDFTVETQIAGGSDLAIMLSLQEQLQEEIIRLRPLVPRRAVPASYDFANPNPNPEMPVVVREIPDSTAPRLLMFRDSFSNALIPFIAEHFSRSAFVWTYRIMQDIVVAEKPDVVVLEFVERNIYEALYTSMQ